MLFFLLCFFVAASSKQVTVSIDATHPHAHTSDRFASFNIDSNWRTMNYSNPRVINPVKAWGPAQLRLGGTFADYCIYDVPHTSHENCPIPGTTRCYMISMEQWTAVLDFAFSNNLRVVYGLNDLYGRKPKTKPSRPEPAGLKWNSTNAEALLQWTYNNIPAEKWPYAFELGNELNDMLLPGSRQAEDFVVLNNIVNKIWRTHPQKPKIVGPDPHSATEFSHGASGVEWMKQFTAFMEKQSHPFLHAFTYHMYILGSGKESDLLHKYFDPKELDRAYEGGSTVKGAIAPISNVTELWVGETAAANNGGRKGITDRYVDMIWYADQLGTLSSLSHQVFQRQALVAGSYGLLNDSLFLNPDYWLGLTWNTLMDYRVLRTTSSYSMLRAYTHCAVGKDGKTSVVLINLDSEDAQVAFSIDTLNNENVSASTSGELYSLQPVGGDVASAEVMLNGKLLTADEENTPSKILGKSTTDGLHVTAPKKSIMFIKLATSLSVCTDYWWKFGVAQYV